MTTLSIPVSGELEKFIERMIEEGKGANKADVVRRALRQMSEDEAVELHHSPPAPQAVPVKSLALQI